MPPSTLYRDGTDGQVSQSRKPTASSMGQPYDRSLVALVVFGLAFQVASALLFFWLRRPLADLARQ